MTARIVSLIASSTEIVHALGMGAYMVGRSHECDYPESVRELPMLTSPKFDVDGSSYEIDQRVKAILQESLSVYRVDAQGLDALSPTHIITQAQCEVCAVSLKDVEAAACEMIGSQPQIVSLQPDCLSEIFRDIERVGSSLAIESRATQVISALKERIARATDKAREARDGSKRPTVAAIEWIEPLMAGGNWLPELIELAEGVNLFGEAGRHSPWMSFAELQEKDPDVILVTPCGFGIERTLQEMHLLAEMPGYADLKAVKTDKVYVADGNQYFNRPGPRVVEALEMLVEMLYPSISFGHAGVGWIRFGYRQ